MDKLRFNYIFGRKRLSIVGAFLSSAGTMGFLLGPMKYLLIPTVVLLTGLFTLSASIASGGKHE